MRALTPDSKAGSLQHRGRRITRDVLALKGEALNEFRRDMQFIFQDPFSSLNPRMTVFDIVASPEDPRHRRRRTAAPN